MRMQHFWNIEYKKQMFLVANLMSDEHKEA